MTKKRLMIFFIAGMFLFIIYESFKETSINFVYLDSDLIHNGELKSISIESPTDSSEEVYLKLDNTINSGELNIVSVKTRYESGRLTEATVYYSPGKDTGNNLRILLIKSDEKDIKDIMRDVASRLALARSSGVYNVIKVNSVYNGKYLVAAEVYYFQSDRNIENNNWRM